MQSGRDELHSIHINKHTHADREGRKERKKKRGEESREKKKKKKKEDELG